MADEKAPSSLENFLTRKVTRRGFMRDFIIAGGALGVGCSPSPKPDIQPHLFDTQLSTNERVTLKEITPNLTKEEVRSLLEKLSPSPYKDFVMRYGYPFFQDVPPKSINLAGVEIMVTDSRVKDGEEKGEIGGRAAIRTVRQSKVFKLQQDHRFSILLPYMIEGSDKEVIRAHIDFKANQDFVQGIEPEITWLSPKSSTIPVSEVDNYKKVRQFTIVKEAFGVAFPVAFMEEVIRDMGVQQMSVYFEDNGRKIEAVSQALIAMLNLNGKFAAISDLGPFILAAKAMQANQPLIDAMRKDPRNITALDAISNIDFGSSSEMVENSIKFILQNKDAVRGAAGHIGNLDQPY